LTSGNLEGLLVMFLSVTQLEGLPLFQDGLPDLDSPIFLLVSSVCFLP